ncbi:hypothetical protein Fot_50413 [Forsythia ovata]|uniref:Uncharacterized protein n=1 Tax=Forsythia ovata TaxID=205694 RepID=A0ABD1PY42_9LAMI
MKSSSCLGHPQAQPRIFKLPHHWWPKMVTEKCEVLHGSDEDDFWAEIELPELMEHNGGRYLRWPFIRDWKKEFLSARISDSDLKTLFSLLNEGSLFGYAVTTT